MKNADMPVSPMVDADGTAVNASGACAHSDPQECIGLTKREYFAGLAMQAYISKEGDVVEAEQYNYIAMHATDQADALLAELEATE